MLEYGYSERNKILLALTLTKNVGTVKILEIIEGSGSFGSNAADLINLVLKPTEAIEFNKIYNQIDIYIEYLRNCEIGIFSYLDSFYPEQLKLLSDPPIILYFKGSYTFLDLPEFFGRQRLGVVGSRKIVPSTSQLLNEIFCSFQSKGIVSVSGMAYGVDTATHLASLKYNIPTIAIVASGVNYPSPAGNTGVYNEILRNGLVISECYPGKNIAPGNFAHRNRIVAALSDVLLVAQAAKNSGSMITPRFAFPIGVEVLAITSNYNDENFAGCHELISEGIAKIYISPESLGSSFGIDLMKVDNYQNLSINEKLVIGFINKNKSTSLEDIMYGTNIERGDLLSLLMKMTMCELIGTDINGLYHML